jgi:cytochrome c biogenesis protein ResB
MKAWEIIILIVIPAIIGGIMGQRYLNKNKKDDSKQKF